MTIFVTSDQHFGHRNIIRLCDRPFETVEEMDAEMQRAWNEVVGTDDDVIHLGDFAFRSAKSHADILAGLNGRKHLIKGNHDPKQDAAGWQSVREYCEMEHDGRLIVMSHYAMEDWNGFYRKSVMLHGHSHGKAKKIERRLDVGVDSIGYKPVTISAAIVLSEQS